MKYKGILGLFLALTLFPAAAGTDVISLSGQWRFRADRDDAGLREAWYETAVWPDSILLPGSMPERLKGDVPTLTTSWTGSIYDSSFYFNPAMEKYRQEGNIKFPFFLTPVRHYLGAAWYEREVTVPDTWQGRSVRLFLERPHIQTQVWVDGRPAGSGNSLCVPHEFDLSAAMTPGTHRLTIRVDNRITEDISVGPDSHSVTDQTQGNWNGMVGRLELQSESPARFGDVQIFPEVEARRARIQLTLSNQGSRPIKGRLRLQAVGYNSDTPDQTLPIVESVRLEPGCDTLEVLLPFGENLQLWDEFHPSLYRLEARLEDARGRELSCRSVSFGMREIHIEGRWIYVNGRKTQMRGTVENCCFPLTGYAPMDVASWERVFRRCKEFGLNHMRFHSFCPPEAAFQAADLVGIYLQPEGPSWPNHGSALGYGKPIDTYLMEETQRMTRAYGNYASFCMLACGNEPRGRWVNWVSRFVDYWKATDSRRIYTGASVGGGWDWQPESQYHVKAGARGLAWKRRPESESDFRKEISFMKGYEIHEPFISHETGQWCVFPNFAETAKYTGVNQALNFELFEEDLADHDMAGLGPDFMMASGKLQLLCYKHEIEKILRTPDYEGFQLLALNDYSGQGSALVGVLDVFWDEKGYCTAEDFRRFCAPTVPLVRMPRFVYRAADTLRASVELSHFGEFPLENAVFAWRLSDADGQECASGKLPSSHIDIGNCQSLGSVEVPLSFVQEAGRYTLEVSLPGTDVANGWNLYVYPDPAPADAGKVLVADTWNPQVAKVLEQGGDVLLLAGGNITYGRDVVQQFLPVFWNTSWFKMRPPHTTGILVRNDHPVFRHFPTDSYADLQWWELMNNTQVMLLSDFPEGFQPIVQPIDTWFLNRKLGLLLEARVGRGRLMVCTSDLLSRPDERPVARQLYACLLEYMQSPDFQPAFQVEAGRIADLFSKESVQHDTFSKATPDELKPKSTQGK